MTILPAELSQGVEGFGCCLWVSLAVTICVALVSTVLYGSYKFKVETKRLQYAREHLEERVKVDFEQALKAKKKRLVLENIERTLEGCVEEFLNGFAVTASLNDLPKSLALQMRGHSLSLQHIDSLIIQATTTKKNIEVTEKDSSTCTIVHPILDSEETVVGTIKFERRKRLSEPRTLLAKTTGSRMRRCSSAKSRKRSRANDVQVYGNDQKTWSCETLRD